MMPTDAIYFFLYERERCMQARKCTKGFFQSPLLLAGDIDELKTTIKEGWIEERGQCRLDLYFVVIM